MHLGVGETFGEGGIRTHARKHAPGWRPNCTIHPPNKTEEALGEGKHVTLLGKDIVSAFNQVRRTKLLQTLRSQSTPSHLTRYVKDFLQPKTCQIGWDGQKRGTVTMGDGAPQGSPLSPVLWLILRNDPTQVRRNTQDDRTTHQQESHPTNLSPLFLRRRPQSTGHHHRHSQGTLPHDSTGQHHTGRGGCLGPTKFRPLQGVPDHFRQTRHQAGNRGHAGGSPQLHYLVLPGCSL